jgi:CO/xanthine dehydrogenase Mo-binding subunit
MERLLDLAARELGIDRAEMRRRNFIPPRLSHPQLLRRPLARLQGLYDAGRLVGGAAFGLADASFSRLWRISVNSTNVVASSPSTGAASDRRSRTRGAFLRR